MMEWTPDNIRLLRIHLGESQEQFAARVGVRRRITVSDWEVGRRNPSGSLKKLFDIIANDAGFTDRVAAKLREKLEREEGE